MTDPQSLDGPFGKDVKRTVDTVVWFTMALMVISVLVGSLYVKSTGISLNCEVQLTVELHARGGQDADVPFRYKCNVVMRFNDLGKT